MFTIGVCDNNPQFVMLFSNKIRELCARYLPDRIECKIAPSFGSAFSVQEYLEKYTIDVLFLDIDMPKMNGFELAKEINDKYPNTLIIFVSAYDNFVYSSFEFSPFRFLRKSHLEKELPITFQKIIEKCFIDGESLSFQSTEGDIILLVKDISYFEANHNYFIIHCTSGEKYRCRGSLTSIEESLIKYDFFRIHTAYIVNESQIESINSSGTVKMKNGDVLSISRRKMPSFKISYSKFLRKRFSR